MLFFIFVPTSLVRWSLLLVLLIQPKISSRHALELQFLYPQCFSLFIQCILLRFDCICVVVVGFGRTPAR
jgi:hypothetical protein